MILRPFFLVVSFHELMILELMLFILRYFLMYILL